MAQALEIRPGGLCAALESGIDEKSVLARVKKEGLSGYAQTLPWVLRTRPTASGIYYDVVEAMSRAQVRVEYTR
jgi:hypothetical protein